MGRFPRSQAEFPNSNNFFENGVKARNVLKIPYFWEIFCWICHCLTNLLLWKDNTCTSQYFVKYLQSVNLVCTLTMILWWSNITHCILGRDFHVFSYISRDGLLLMHLYVKYSIILIFFLSFSDVTDGTKCYIKYENCPYFLNEQIFKGVMETSGVHCYVQLDCSAY